MQLRKWGNSRVSDTVSAHEKAQLLRHFFGVRLRPVGFNPSAGKGDCAMQNKTLLLLHVRRMHVYRE